MVVFDLNAKAIEMAKSMETKDAAVEQKDNANAETARNIVSALKDRAVNVGKTISKAGMNKNVATVTIGVETIKVTVKGEGSYVVVKTSNDPLKNAIGTLHGKDCDFDTLQQELVNWIKDAN